ncbi:MAG: DUF1887 family protein [Lachnospiraceae bacterium]|nr:DUF1887 family protein [Lachnospiraceae bacterium]
MYPFQEIQTDQNADVYNEVDVLAIKDNIPLFISCKSGKMDSKAATVAFFEIKTVADRIGGKYARKALATTHSLTKTSSLRAREMGIEIITEN